MQFLHPGAPVKFAKILFYFAGIWGILVINAAVFYFNQIAEKDPPPVTHPLFYYGSPELP